MLIFFWCLIGIQVQLFTPSEVLQGAWEMKTGGAPGDQATLIATENYLSIAIFNPDAKSFTGTYGGPYRLENGSCRLTYEFDTRDSGNIGKEVSFKIQVTETSLTLDNLVKTTWNKLDQSPSTAPLAGCWRITARAGNDGQMSPMNSGPRKTIKMLSGTRFQWIAINPASKQFFGTGGGTYTLKDGKYTEHISFFSRDGSRVGSELGFNAVVDNGKWKHSGTSSTGNPVNEIWEKQ